jgi:hypothetical protein
MATPMSCGMKMFLSTCSSTDGCLKQSGTDSNASAGSHERRSVEVESRDRPRRVDAVRLGGDRTRGIEGGGCSLRGSSAGIARPANKDVAVKREANGKSKRSERRMKAVKLDRVGYLQ